MLISRYSKPDFDPYGENSPEPEVTLWVAPVATAPTAAVLSLPGSKSLTNRELVLSALADGPSLLRAPLHSRDSDLMVEALRELGTVIEQVPFREEFSWRWIVQMCERVLKMVENHIKVDGDPHPREPQVRAGHPITAGVAVRPTRVRAVERRPRSR